MALAYKHILEAFQPAKEISDPQRFSGRKKQVERCAELLLSQDHIFIHGIRGIGKSSLARQVALMASGDTRLLASISSPLEKEKFDFVTCFLTRDASISNVNDLLFRLLIDKNALARWYDLLGLNEVGTYELGSSLNPRLVSDFWSRVEACSKLASHGVAIFIDEFELIDHHEGFASLIKANPTKCIFIVTGIGKTEKQLVRDHTSIERQLDTGKLEVPEMSDEELRLVVSKAEQLIEREITFNEDATNQLIKIVRGHPYLLHLVGKHSLLLAFKEKRKTISVDTLQQALREIAFSRADRTLEDRYLKAIGNSPMRETVLRVFAQSEAENVHTSQAYPEADRQRVSNPSYWVGDLQKEQYGAELEKVADQYYRLRDPLFQAYVAATPPRLASMPENETDSTEQAKEKFVIVQLSDVHFGGSHYFSNLPIAADTVPEADKPQLGRYIAESLTSLPKKSGEILIISGDLTQSALTTEFEQGRQCIAQILNAMMPEELRSKRLVVVPGNHDVNWTIQKADPKARYLGFSAYIRFKRELGQHIDDQVEPERLYSVHDYIDSLGCVILALNSAVIEHPDDHRGYVGESQIRNAMEEVNTCCSGRKVIKIAVLHHHIIPVQSLESTLKKPDEVLQDAYYVKQALLDNGFSLVLHGHRHHAHEEQIGNGTHTMVVVGCGSTGVRIEERGSQPLQFNRIHIGRKVQEVDSQVEIKIERYHFDTVRHKWLASEDHKPKKFTIRY